MIELIVFLGNYGREYARNRHNAAWLLAEKAPYGELARQRKFKGSYAALDRLRLGVMSNTDNFDISMAPDSPSRLHFLWPETYMNRSGDAVKEAAAFYKIPPANILVIHDDLELALGVAALKFSGGLGGHNGLRSLRAVLGTPDFWRLRIGIGRPDHRDIASYVLSDFTTDEKPILERVLSQLAEALTKALVNGPESLLPEWTKKRLAE